MSTNQFKATFEREVKPADNFGEAKAYWEEITQEVVKLEPLNGRELIDAQQKQSQSNLKATAIWSPTLDGIKTSDRIKWPKRVPELPEEPTNDKNFRIFHIEAIQNVREMNKELQFMVVERG